jgi:hypothetical protein
VTGREKIASARLRANRRKSHDSRYSSERDDDSTNINSLPTQGAITVPCGLGGSPQRTHDRLKTWQSARCPSAKFGRERIGGFSESLSHDAQKVFAHRTVDCLHTELPRPADSARRLELLGVPGKRFNKHTTNPSLTQT